jgi:hypothetical protein
MIGAFIKVSFHLLRFDRATNRDHNQHVVNHYLYGSTDLIAFVVWQTIRLSGELLLKGKALYS